jgi:hypothetical protein
MIFDCIVLSSLKRLYILTTAGASTSSFFEYT